MKKRPSRLLRRCVMNSSFLESTELDRRERRRLRRCRGGSPFGRWSSLGGSELLGRWFSFPDSAAAGVAVESWFMASLMSGLGATASGLMMTCRTCSGAGGREGRGRGGCLGGIRDSSGTGRVLARWKRWLVSSGVGGAFRGARIGRWAGCRAWGRRHLRNPTGRAPVAQRRGTAGGALWLAPRLGVQAVHAAF